MAKGQLTVRVLGDTKPFERSVKGISKTLGTVAKVGGAAFAAAGAAAVTGAFKVAEFGDEVAKSAGKAGFAVEPFQELRFAFGQGGVDAAKFDKAAQNLNRRLGESATTGGSADEAFSTLGIALRDAGGDIRDTTAVMDDVLPALAAIESDAERAAVAGDLFGQRAGPELAAALSDGIGGIDEARAKAQELGIVMGGEAAEAAEKFTDQWDDIKQSATGLLRDGLTPVMTYMSDTVFPVIQDGIGRVRELAGVFEEAGGGIGGLKAVFADLFSGEGGLFAGLLEAAQEAFANLVAWLSEGGFTTIFDTILAGRERLFDAALELFPALLDAAIEFIPQLLDWITGTMIPQVLEFIVGAVPRLLEAGLELFRSLIDAVIEVLPDLLGTLANDVLPAVLDAIIEMIPDLLEAAVELFQMLVQAVIDVLPDLIRTLFADVLPAVLRSVLEMIPDLLSTAVELFLMLVQAVIDVLPELVTILVTEVLPTLLETIVDMIPELLDAGIELFTALIEAIPEILPQLVGIIVTDLIPAVIDAVMQLVPKLFDAGKAIIQGLIDGIRDMIGAVGDAVGDVAGKVRDFWPFSPAKEGPLSGSGSPEIAGANIGGMIAGGLAGSVSDIRRAAERAAAAAHIDVVGGDGASMPTSFPARQTAGPFGTDGGVTVNVYGDVVTDSPQDFLDQLNQMARSR